MSRLRRKLPGMSDIKNKPKKSYHHGDLRKALVDLAAGLLKTEGEAGLSMRKLAELAGVSRTAAYHHFKDKHDLLCAIAEEGFRAQKEVFNPPEYGPNSPVDEQRIQRFVVDYINFATEKSQYYDLMFGGQLWKSEKLTSTLKVEAYDAFKAYVDGIRAWQASGVISQSIDPLRYSQVSWSTLHGMSRLLIDGIYLDNEAKGSMCEAAAEMLWRELNS